MSDWSRPLLLAACMSLVAGTAAAAIPDSTGVFHACYNILSGSLKLIDGTTCGLLERHVAWNQQGVPGPRGPIGPQGPEGPPGEPATVMVDTINFQARFPRTGEELSRKEYGDKVFTAAADGKCIVTVRAGVWQLEEFGIPLDSPIYVAPAYLENGTTNVIWNMNATWLLVKELQAPQNTFMSGIATITFDVRAGYTYKWGALLSTPAGYLPDRAWAAINITTQCTYND